MLSCLRELTQYQSAGQRADPTVAHAVNNLQRADVDQSARVGEGVTHAG